MNAWVIYNGALRINKMELIAKRLAETAKFRGVELELIKNNEIMPYYDELGVARLRTLKSLRIPEFIIFWDKDIILAKHLETMGFLLFNSSKAIETCDNKSLTHLELANLGIRIPRTLQSPFTFSNQQLSDEYIEQVFDLLGSKVVIKESYGSFGMQVSLVSNEEEFKEVINKMGNRGFIAQEYIETSFGTDIRVNIIGDKIVGAMKRTGTDDFRANISLGGKGSIYELNNKQREIALEAHKALKLDFCGLDLLFGENKEPILCEINSNVNFMSFEEVTGIDFAGKLIEYILEKVK